MLLKERIPACSAEAWGCSQRCLHQPRCKPCSRFVPDDDFLGARASRPHKAGTASPISTTSINRKGTVPGPLCKGCSRFVPHYHSPLEGESHEMRERGRPARTRLAQLHLSPPRRSTGNGTVPGPLCKGCSRFVPYHSPLEGESQKPSRQAKADAVGGRDQATGRSLMRWGVEAGRQRGAATPDRFSTVLIY